MANTTTPRSPTYSGLFYDAVTPAIKIYNRGTLVETISGNDVTFEDNLVPASVTTITGNTSAYVEGTITGLLGALAGLGLITDSTT